jgi:hypothetical protein
LTHPAVRALLHQLPHAGHCERYMGWEGDKPEVPELVRGLGGGGAVGW